MIKHEQSGWIYIFFIKNSIKLCLIMHNDGWAWLFLEGWGASWKTDGLRQKYGGSHEAKGLTSYTKPWAVSIGSCDPLIVTPPSESECKHPSLHHKCQVQNFFVMFPYVSLMKGFSSTVPKQRFSFSHPAQLAQGKRRVLRISWNLVLTWNNGRKIGAKGTKKMRNQLNSHPEMGTEWNWHIPESRVWCPPVN